MKRVVTKQKWYSECSFSHIANALHRKALISPSSSQIFSWDFWLRQPRGACSFLCSLQRAMRIEPEQPHTNSFSTCRKILRLLIIPIISLENGKVGALCRQWAEIHPIPHKVHLLAFEVQSDPQFGRTGNVSIIVINSHVVTYTMLDALLKWGKCNARNNH